MPALGAYEYDVKDEVKNIVDFAKITLYFINSTTQKLYKTKLNKLLFYSQFYYYKLNKRKIIENEFILDHFGPICEKMDDYLNQLNDVEIITLNETEYGTYISSNGRMVEGEYTIQETIVLEAIMRKFDMFTSMEMSEYFYKELIYKKAKINSVIDLNWADELHEF